MKSMRWCTVHDRWRLYYVLLLLLLLLLLLGIKHHMSVHGLGIVELVDYDINDFPEFFLIIIEKNSH